MSKLAAPYLKSANGCIVNTSSISAISGVGSSIAYAASKGALSTMTLSLAHALAPEVRVNAVCPATVKTPMTDAIFKDLGEKRFEGDTEAAWKAEANTIPLGRIAAPEEIANVVYFLSQDESSFMTGALLPVDGGFTAQ